MPSLCDVLPWSELLPKALPVQVYYAPRQPVYCQVALPTIFGGFRLLRTILVREGITLVHAHQAFSVMGHEAILQARTMGYKVSGRLACQDGMFQSCYCCLSIVYACNKQSAPTEIGFHSP